MHYIILCLQPVDHGPPGDPYYVYSEMIIGIKPFSFFSYKVTNELNEVEKSLYVLSLKSTKSRGPDGKSVEL